MTRPGSKRAGFFAEKSTLFAAKMKLGEVWCKIGEILYMDVG
jgi:hypothetical protein